MHIVNDFFSPDLLVVSGGYEPSLPLSMTFERCPEAEMPPSIAVHFSIVDDSTASDLCVELRNQLQRIVDELPALVAFFVSKRDAHKAAVVQTANELLDVLSGAPDDVARSDALAAISGQIHWAAFPSNTRKHEACPATGPGGLSVRCEFERPLHARGQTRVSAQPKKRSRKRSRALNGAPR